MQKVELDVNFPMIELSLRNYFLEIEYSSSKAMVATYIMDAVKGLV